jgi:hypothetical protein
MINDPSEPPPSRFSRADWMLVVVIALCALVVWVVR